MKATASKAKAHPTLKDRDRTRRSEDKNDKQKIVKEKPTSTWNPSALYF